MPISQWWPGIAHFWDFDRTISQLYGVVSADGSVYERQTIVLDSYPD